MKAWLKRCRKLAWLLEKSLFFFSSSRVVGSSCRAAAQDSVDTQFAAMDIGSGFAGWLSSCTRYIFREQRLHFFGTLAVLVVFFVFMMAFQVNLQWFWLLLYAALILPFAPYVTKPEFFFR